MTDNSCAKKTVLIEKGSKDANLDLYPAHISFVSLEPSKAIFSQAHKLNKATTGMISLEIALEFLGGSL
jgi:hypothetical protein